MKRTLLVVIGGILLFFPETCRHNAQKKSAVLFLFASFCALTQAVEPEIITLREGSDGSSVLSQYGTNFGFFMPETGGYFYTGLIVGDESIWLHEAKKCKIDKQKKGWTVSVSDPKLGKGKLVMHVLPLMSSNGLIIELSGENLPEGLQFLWGYGGCSAKTDASEKTAFFQPEQCKDNVFSRGNNSFTVYFGPNVGLRVMMGVAPPETQTRLSDARKMNSPLEFLNSGKKTNAPAMSAVNQIKSGERYYYCIYRQNQLADYNYYMLPSVFQKELNTKTNQINEKARSHTGFGPDFNK